MLLTELASGGVEGARLGRGAERCSAEVVIENGWGSEARGEERATWSEWC